MPQNSPVWDLRQANKSQHSSRPIFDALGALIMSAKSSESAATSAPTNSRTSETSGTDYRREECHADFGDSGSKRVLAGAAVAVARELGRQAAREYFQELIQPRRPS